MNMVSLLQKKMKEGRGNRKRERMDVSNGMLKKQYEALRVEYPCHVESLIVVQIVSEMQDEDEYLTADRFLWNILLPGGNGVGEKEQAPEEEMQEMLGNIFSMLNGLTLVIGCPPTFPIERPHLKIVSNPQLYHPNIDRETGMMRCSFIESEWCPAMTLTKIVAKVREILVTPDLKVTANSDAAKTYVSDRTEYYRNTAASVIDANDQKAHALKKGSKK